MNRLIHTRRDERTLVPSGSTVLLAGDRLTVIGDPRVVLALRLRLERAP